VSSESEDLAARLLAWDGQGESARTLRREVQQLAQAGQTARPQGEVPGVRGLAKALELYRSPGRSPRTLGAWLLKDKNAQDAQVFAPLLGDEAMGSWPFWEPLALSEPETVLWSEVLEKLRPAVDEHMRRFVGVGFQVRRRQTWPASCRAWAALALRDEVLRDKLARLWQLSYPQIGASWPKNGLAAASERLGPNSAHILRHALFLSCAWRAMGGDPLVAGIDGTKLASMPLPPDDADRSVVLASLTELLRSGDPAVADRAAMEPLLVKRAKETGSEELSEVAFRELLSVLGSGPARDALRAALVRPRWKPARVDALWEWLNTAAWFQERGDEEAVAQMLAEAGEAKEALLWRLGRTSPDSPVDELIARLAQLLDADRLAVVPLRRRAVLLAETRLLMAADDIKPLPWTSIVNVAQVGHPHARHALRGSVEEVGEPSLCVLLAELSLTSRTLMRDVVLDPANVLRVGGIQDGFIAGQVAVQTGRILRELDSTSDKVRFLWNLLQQDPPFRTFAELGLVLRTEFVLTDDGRPSRPVQDNPLRAMVQAVSTLDQRRDEGADIQTIAQAFADLVSATQSLLGGDERVGSALDALAHALEAAVEQEADLLDDPHWFARFENVVLGTEPRGGLVGWAWWLADRNPADDLLHQKRAMTVKGLSRLRAAVQVVRSARPGVTNEQHEELSAAASALHDQIGPLGWPETKLVDSLLTRLQQRSQDALAQGRRSRAAVKNLNVLLERADEVALSALIRDPEQMELMPVEELRRIHRDLLGQLRFSDAEYLRRAAASRIRLPDRVSHMMPLFGAVAGGTFLVLDVADSWLSLVPQEAWGRYAATMAMALGASYSLLLNDLSPRINTGAATPLKRARILVFRTLPTFLQAAAVSVMVSALAMATLGALTPTLAGMLSLALWSSLALFLGVFIGLISQGQSATNTDR
jgi:hypothetical protein